MILPNAFGHYAARGSFTPPQLANMVFWGDANTLAGGDGALISSFTDLSGNANHATASGSLRPTLKTNIVNGKQVLRFDGTDDVMAWPNLFGAATTGTLVVMIKANADPAASAITSKPWDLAKTGAVGSSAHSYTDGFIYEHFGSDTSVQAMPKPSSAASFHAYSVTIQANKMVIHWNGVIIGGQDFSSPGFLAAPTLSDGTSKYAGDIAEIMLYKVVLSRAELKTINTYLAAKYAVSVADVTTLATPSSFSGLQGWWKADSLSLNDNDPVSSWTDSSGNGRTLTGTLTQRPLYKTNLYNGLPAVRWDGSNDRLEMAAEHSLGDLTFIGIALSNVDNGNMFGHDIDNYQTRTRRGGNVMNFYANGGSEFISSLAFKYAVTAFKLYGWTRNGTTGALTWWQNGVELEATAGNTTAFKFKSLGWNPFGIQFGGDMGEVCYWNTVLSRSDMARLYYEYFRDRWALP